ncbi:MAG: zf-TFIIB domain-containing protein [Ignavibacteriae bacterium]|jgi:Zn-finger nucleic acid-binding protein|nr:hypothetical protein [Ignavibacteriota bacterium]NOH00365.1 zf-TFIIB domain-containing protein [Ignavibacteriota bacterium]
MDCPNCKEPMIVLELSEVEIDYCISCKGIWLDSGELELLLDEDSNLENSNLFNTPLNISEEKKKCPICNKKMGKVEIGDEEKILIDKCLNSHGLWFDENELHQIIQVASKKNKALDLLNDIFQNEINPTDEEEE